MIVVRYVDDIVIGFRHRAEAERFWRELGNRVRKELHPEKARLIEFGRFARRRTGKSVAKESRETFPFPGFTHYCAEIHQGGYFGAEDHR